MVAGGVLVVYKRFEVECFSETYQICMVSIYVSVRTCLNRCVSCRKKKKNRDENKLLRARDKDAAELRSLLEQKRGVSAQLARGAEAARARAERAERAAEETRTEAMSLR